MTIIVDSDGLIGLLDKEDAHYVSAQMILEKLAKEKTKFIYPATVIVESTTILRIRLKKPEVADQITRLLLSGLLLVESIDEILLKKAVSLLEEKGGDSHNTLFDGVVAAVANKYSADAIFSFDRFYKKIGFTLAEDL